MFLGEYEYSLDVKGRIFIPAKFREALGEKFVITRGIDRCLAVYPEEEWIKYTEKINELPSSTARRIRRFVYAGACEAEADSHGRTVIPQNLREFAGIEKESNIYITGAGSYIEIWSEEGWNAERAAESSEEIAELMEQLGC
ncbi:MAG: division/cell wall cluster transcriptional repressor MraZ [Clostridiales bacterium]|nr:division/cell wall cluster transcriptional repressor MraZ [Clostridiales bacterium]